MYEKPQRSRHRIKLSYIRWLSVNNLGALRSGLSRRDKLIFRSNSFLRIQIPDEVEFHLKNHPDNKLPHNIDLHAVTGPGGGAESSFVAAGHKKVFSFKVGALTGDNAITANVGETVR